MSGNNMMFQKMLTLAAIILLTVIASGCSDDDNKLDGAQLYFDNCAFCHGTRNQGVSAPIIIGLQSADIDQAIIDVPTMNFLSTLTNAEIDAISGHLIFLASQ